MSRCRDMRQDVGEFRKDIVEFVIERRCVGIVTFGERRADKTGLEARFDVVGFANERRCIGIRRHVGRRIGKVEIEASRDNRAGEEEGVHRVNRAGEEERVHRVETGGVHREGQSFDKHWRQTEFFDISDGAPPTF